MKLLSAMFGDHMVLQRNKPSTFWGWATPGKSVSVAIAGRSVTTLPNAGGRWEAKIDPPEVGGPYELVVSTSDEIIRLRDILVGDVWLCGGQSNMEWSLAGVKDARAALAEAGHPQIRLFRHQTQPRYQRECTPSGSWKVCSFDAVSKDGGFSAVGYFFGTELSRELNIPIGLVQVAVGGSPAETWASEETCSAFPEFAKKMEFLQQMRARSEPEYGNYVSHWYDLFDIGARGETWASPGLVDRDWSIVELPSRAFTELGLEAIPAVAWFRREIDLPEELPSGQVRLLLGQIEQMDTAFINGKEVGASGWVESMREYFLPADLLKPGKNLIALRVFKMNSPNGFLSDADSLQLVLGDGRRTPLAGSWKAQVIVRAESPHPLPLGFENWPVIPSVLFNGMIAPIAPLSISGVLWYQGESNAERANQYWQLLPALIRDWRTVFQQGELPFYIVGLPYFTKRKEVPGDDSWAELREAQAMTAKTTANCALVVTIDTGDEDDIHPRDKRPVGVRSARMALAKYYGRRIVAEGPTFRSMETISPQGNEPGALCIRFDHTEGGLMFKGPPDFAVAGIDRRWAWAAARIDGDSVVVRSPEVPEPLQVRYAWQANPNATLFNGAGLPACPFRTDNWPRE